MAWQCLIGQTPIKEQKLENIFQEIVNFSIEKVLEDVKTGGQSSAELSSSALEVIASLMARKVTERTQSFDKIFSFDFFSSLDTSDPESLFKMQPPELKKVCPQSISDDEGICLTILKFTTLDVAGNISKAWSRQL